MQIQEAYFRTALREEFARRQRANTSYSLRAFAKQLGMQAPTLSAVLAGKRPLSMAAAETLPEKLSFSPAEKKRFLNSVYYRKAPPAVVHSIEESSAAKTLREELHFKIIAEWEHYAVLTLVETRGFRAEKGWIAKRLRISDARAQTALDRLKEAGLISVDSIGRTRLHQVNVMTTSEETASVALRQSHREALTMGIEKLESLPIELRDFSSMTIAVSMDKLKDAKKLIRNFQEQISKLLEDGKRTEVYQICVQLYPLSDLESQEGNPS
jgi:uncharacterized protein (TIGR02147 family)